MRTVRATSCPAVRLYRRFDYGCCGDNLLKDFASFTVLSLCAAGVCFWVLVACAAVAAYREGYPL